MLHTEPKLLPQVPERLHQYLPHLTEVPAIPRVSSRTLFTQVESVQLPKAKYSFDASKILDELQLPN